MEREPVTMDLYRLRDKFDQLCRFCLSDENCVAIFTEELQLNDRLASLVDVLLTKVDESDGLPNRICAKCVHCMEQFVQFEAACERSYEILGKVLELPDEERVASPVAKTECPQIEETVPEAIEEYLIDKPSHDTEDDSYMEEGLVERLEDEQVSGIEDMVTDLHEEDVRYTSEEDRGSHSANASYRITAEQQQMLDDAMQVQSSGFIKLGNRSIPLVQCIYCKNTYRGRNTLKKHLRIHLNIKDNQCAYCPRTFTDRSTLRIHEGRHTGKTFKCPHCDKPYYSQNELRQHITMQHLERQYTCETCQKKFPTKTILNDHYRVHTQERPFVCTLCGADFKRNRNLVRHQNLHEKYEKKATPQLSCMVCSDQFELPNALLEHLKTKHADEFDSLRTGSFECPQCDVSTFENIEDCLKHRQIHYDYELSETAKKHAPRRKQPPSFHCGECGKIFKSRMAATKHMGTHEGSRYFLCDVPDCGILYKDSAVMEVHRKESHTKGEDILN